MLVTKEFILYDSSYIKFKTSQNQNLYCSKSGQWVTFGGVVIQRSHHGEGAKGASRELVLLDLGAGYMGVLNVSNCMCTSLQVNHFSIKY